MEALILLSVAFGPLAFGAVEPWAVFLLQALLLGLLAGRAASGRPWRGAPVYRSFLPAAAGLMLLGLLQWLNPVSLAGPKSALPFSAFRQGTEGFLLLWSAYLAFLVCAAQVFASAAALRRFAWALLLLGSFVGAAALVQRAQGNAWIYGLRPVPPHLSPFGPYLNSDHAASLLSMSLLAGGGLWWSRWSSWREGEPGKSADLAATQFLLLFLLGVIAFALWKARSRGAFLSLAGAAGSVALLGALTLPAGRSRRLALCALGLSAAGGLAFLAARPWWIGNIGGLPDGSTEVRLSIYRGVWRMLSDFPLFGAGLGTFAAAYPAYRTGSIQGMVDHAHSDWLELGAEGGLLGLFLYTAGLALLARQAWRAWKSCRSTELSRLGAGMLAAALAFLLHGAVDFSLQIPGNALVFLGLLAWLGSPAFAPGGLGEPADRELGHRPPWALRLAAWPAVFLLLAASARPALAWWHLRRSRSAEGEEKLARLRRAVEWSAAPATLHRAAGALLRRAVETPAERERLLGEALTLAARSVEAAPADRAFLMLKAEALRGLGRQRDARVVVEAIEDDSRWVR